MKVFGIILEANPFHYGHQYFINEIKKEYKPDLLIAITSTSFTMRGEISLLDKFTKTNLLLENGIDIVLELPFILGVQSADYFAKNCVDILNLLKITDLAFGSETTNINLYHQFYDFISQQQIDTNDFKAYSKKQQINALLHSSNFSKEDISIINRSNKKETIKTKNRNWHTNGRFRSTNRVINICNLQRYSKNSIKKVDFYNKIW